MVKQRGRKSAEATAVVRLVTAQRPLKPPAEMPMKAKAIFAEIVASCGATHFRQGDVQLLSQYCNAAYLAGYYAPLIGDADGAFKAWESATKIMAQLSTKLRLAPSTRLDPKTVARHDPPPGPAPWDPEPDDRP